MAAQEGEEQPNREEEEQQEECTTELPIPAAEAVAPAESAPPTTQQTLEPLNDEDGAGGDGEVAENGQGTRERSSSTPTPTTSSTTVLKEEDKTGGAGSSDSSGTGAASNACKEQENTQRKSKTEADNGSPQEKVTNATAVAEDTTRTTTREGESQKDRKVASTPKIEGVKEEESDPRENTGEASQETSIGNSSYPDATTSPPFAAAAAMLDSKTLDHDTEKIRRHRGSLTASTTSQNSSSRSLPGAFAVSHTLTGSTTTCPPTLRNSRTRPREFSTSEVARMPPAREKEETKQEEMEDSSTSIPMIPVQFAPQPAASLLVAVGEEIEEEVSEPSEHQERNHTLPSQRIPISRDTTRILSQFTATPLSRGSTDPGTSTPSLVVAPTGQPLSASLTSRYDDTLPLTITEVPPLPEPLEIEAADPRLSDRQEPEGSGSLHMIVAELVGPLVRAVQVVLFDDDGHQVQTQQQQQPTGILNDADQETARPREGAVEKYSLRSLRRGVWLVLVLLVILLCVGVPLLVIRLKRDTASNTQDGVASMPPPVLPSVDYDCFDSTAEFLQAQQDGPREQILFIFCPNTEIIIGTIANIYNNDTRFINGEPPIMVIRSNVEVRCGLDGRVENNCVLRGGVTQVIFQPIVPGPERFQLIRSELADNVTIRGMTFTGVIDVDPFLGGSSASLSNAGNVLMVDCLWEEMSSAYGLIYVGTNRFQELYGLDPIPTQSAVFTIANSTFRDIEYDTALADAYKQTLKFSGCRFENIRMTQAATQCDSAGDIWCQGLASCTYGSFCSFEDICVENFEYASAGVLASYSNTSQLQLSGLFYMDAIYHSSKAQRIEACPSGFADVDDSRNIQGCVGSEEAEDHWTRVQSCMLD